MRLLLVRLATTMETFDCRVKGVCYQRLGRVFRCGMSEEAIISSDFGNWRSVLPEREYLKLRSRKHAAVA